MMLALLLLPGGTTTS